MDDAFETYRSELAAALARYRVQLAPFESDSPDGGVRFDFEIGPVVVRGALRRNLTVDIAAEDVRTGPLVQATHRLIDLAGMQEVLASALHQFEIYANGDTQNLDWSDQGVPWWDASKDDYLARDWLAAGGRGLQSDDIYDRVLELTQTDLDPARGWRLVQKLIEFAGTDEQLWRIGAGPLATIVREHPELVREELTNFYRSDRKWRRAFEGQISTALGEFKRQVEQNPGTGT
jgi:hypothetical protein